METNSSPTTEVSVKDLFNLLVVDLTLHRRVPDTLHTSLSLQSPGLHVLTHLYSLPAVDINPAGLSDDKISSICPHIINTRFVVSVVNIHLNIFVIQSVLARVDFMVLTWVLLLVLPGVELSVLARVYFPVLSSLVVDVRLSGVASSVVLVVAEVILQSQH